MMHACVCVCVCVWVNREWRTLWQLQCSYFPVAHLHIVARMVSLPVGLFETSHLVNRGSDSQWREWEIHGRDTCTGTHLHLCISQSDRELHPETRELRDKAHGKEQLRPLQMNAKCSFRSKSYIRYFTCTNCWHHLMQQCKKICMFFLYLTKQLEAKQF